MWNLTPCELVVICFLEQRSSLPPYLDLIQCMVSSAVIKRKFRASHGSGAHCNSRVDESE